MNGAGQDKQSAAQLLAWYRDMGIDEAIAAEPQNRFEESKARAARPKPAAQTPIKAPVKAPLTSPPAPSQDTRPTANAASLDIEANTLDARKRAAACKTLVELREAMEDFDGLTLKKTAKNLVFGDGNPEASVMFIGEAPGRDEDIQGKPFVGRSGQLLDRMMAAIGLDRTSAYITNVIAWRPPGNRTPTPAETAVCRPFIDRHIELVNPKVLVFLGGVAAKEMLGVTTGIMRLRGKWMEFPPNEHTYRAIATLHPAYLLRQPAHKRLAWRDFLEIKRMLDAQTDVEPEKPEENNGQD